MPIACGLKPTPLSSADLTAPSTHWPEASGNVGKLPVLGFISGDKHTLLTSGQDSGVDTKQAGWIGQLNQGAWFAPRCSEP